MYILEYNLIEKEILKANDIFDFISIIFYYLSQEKITHLFRRYGESMMSKKYEKEFMQIEELFSILFLYNEIDKEHFCDFLNEWISLYKSIKNDHDIFCLETLYSFDKNYANYSLVLKTSLQEQGPLNKAFNDKVLFYNIPPDSYLNDYLKMNNIRKGRQTVPYDPSNLDSKFQNFHIVNVNSLNSLKPKVIKYTKSINIEDTSLIGIIASKIDDNFKVKLLDDKCKLFNIEYTNEKFESHMKYIFDIITRMDEHGFKIIIFPELFLFPQSLDKLKKFLCSNQLNNIQLIFTGSEWENNKNSAYILSSSGTVLSKHSKKASYEHYCKENGITYSENIEKENDIEFLDILGIGRISYLICRDFLTDYLRNLCTGIMESNIMCISAYTNKTNLMIKSSEDIAKLKGAASILCNSCSAIIDNENLLGYMIIPKVENKQLTYSKKIFSKDDMDCNNCQKCFLSN